jgi:hypothetical protein
VEKENQNQNDELELASIFQEDSRRALFQQDLNQFHEDEQLSPLDSECMSSSGNKNGSKVDADVSCFADILLG